MIRNLMEAYQVLGLPFGAPLPQVKTAYHALAKRFHPDVAGGDAEKLQAVNEAYDFVLSYYVNYDKMTRQENPAGTLQFNSARKKSRVLGQESGYYTSKKERERFDKTMKVQVEERKAAEKQALENKVAETKRLQKQYDDAMKAIRAIQAAEIIKNMIRENQ